MQRRRNIVRKLALVGAVTLALAAAAQGEEEPCGGLGMPRTSHHSFDNDLIKSSGAFVADGELIADGGRHTCVAITIECNKEKETCQMVDVNIVKLSGG